MKITYDPHNDKLHILFRSVPIEHTDSDKDGMSFDYDETEQVVDLEVRAASRQLNDPRSVEFLELTEPDSTVTDLPQQ